MHVCSICKHSWAGPCVASNPLAELQPHLSSEGVVVFKTNCTWELLLASKFVMQTKSQVVFLATVEQIGALNVTHRATHGSDVEHRFEGFTKLLAELEQEIPRVFAVPEFPSTKLHFSYLWWIQWYNQLDVSCIHCRCLSCKSYRSKCMSCLSLDVLYQAVALMVHPYCLQKRKVVVARTCALIIDL